MDRSFAFFHLQILQYLGMDVSKIANQFNDIDESFFFLQLYNNLRVFDDNFPWSSHGANSQT